MKNIILICILQLISIGLFAQEEEIEIATGSFCFSEESVEPHMGHAKFLKTVYKKLKYPKEAKKAGITGRVYIQFVVEENGQLSNFKILRGLGYGCDEEAIRVIKKVASLPNGKWKSTPIKGNRLYYTLPINFKR